MTRVIFHFRGVERNLISDLTDMLVGRAVVLHQTLDEPTSESTVRAVFSHANFAQFPVMWAVDKQIHVEINPPD